MFGVETFLVDNFAFQFSNVCNGVHSTYGSFTDLVLVSNLCVYFASVSFSELLIGAPFPWFLRIKKSKYRCYTQKPMHWDFAKSDKKRCKSRRDTSYS